MNQLTVNSRKFFREHRNGATFSTDTGVYSTFFKANTLERVKFSTNISVVTKVIAAVTSEITYEDDGTDSSLTHDYLTWAEEGFKVGDTIKVIQGADEDTATITGLVGTVMYLSGNDFTGAPLSLVDGTSYSDLKVYNTTVPTTLNFQFNIVPNILPPPSLTTSGPNFLSILDSQPQQYTVSGISGTLQTMTATMQANAEISESIEVEWISTGADGFTFTFELHHIFRVPFYIADWLTYFVNQTFPFAFTAPASWRYICQYQFGTDATDPNEYRVFTDQALNGASGFVGQNFTNGVGGYNVLSVVYTDTSLNVRDELEVTDTNLVTLQLKKTTGNFAAGEKAILYVVRLPSVSQYSNTANTWNSNFVFDSVTAVDGGAAIDGDFIEDMLVVVNGDPTKLDITFKVIYNTAQKAAISGGEYYGIFVTVGDITLSAALSDSKVVWCDVNTFAKNTDIPGLITGNTFEVYSSEKTPNGASSTTQFSSWNNRLHQAIVHFNLTKSSGLPYGKTAVTSLNGQIISRNATTGDSFVLEDYPINFGSPLSIAYSLAYYQLANVTNYRDFNINPTAQANKSTVLAVDPGAYSATQEWIVRWPMVVNWREWQNNPNVPTEFYNALADQFNLNYRTSNYSAVSGWDIYIRLLVVVTLGAVNTTYELLSSKCTVRDFDVDPPTANWTATTQLFDEDGNEKQELIIGDDMRIKTTFSMATAGAMDPAFLFAEHTIEETLSTGENCRLHSSVDWSYPTNKLKPLAGETKVKITQDVPGNKIIVESLIDKDYVDNTKSYNVYTHLQETR